MKIRWVPKLRVKFNLSRHGYYLRYMAVYKQLWAGALVYYNLLL